MVGATPIDGKSSRNNTSKKKKIDEDAEPIVQGKAVKASKSTGSKKKKQIEEVTFGLDDIPAKVCSILIF